MGWEVGRGSFRNRPQRGWGQALKVDQKVGAGNLRSGTENGGQASVEGRILFVCVLGERFRNIHAKTIQKSHFASKQGKAFLKFLPKHVGGSYAL